MRNSVPDSLRLCLVLQEDLITEIVIAPGAYDPTALLLTGDLGELDTNRVPFTARVPFVGSRAEFLSYDAVELPILDAFLDLFDTKRISHD
jgi:hypothetical protein